MIPTDAIKEYLILLIGLKKGIPYKQKNMKLPRTISKFSQILE
ncbi:hypothetical protein LEP1GSC203_2760 [Leptospira terpstrae serovar Hualin str. LT 11-33 = ATCC 700639]|uniref:Uncharacterized protein n=1 Tax=Leptospira terpstrae serovar Hualin str. LT 11-33 = ATCC 700639 TaxID=1257025 RepID=N1W2G6_9LEPT|nr:hypothetical protein LEP1GSC203_2760 [Leptospira terpstrae serovar Hualin str. LT 11-33 = ATCC 700639]